MHAFQVPDNRPSEQVFLSPFETWPPTNWQSQRFPTPMCTSKFDSSCTTSLAAFGLDRFPDRIYEGSCLRPNVQRQHPSSAKLRLGNVSDDMFGGTNALLAVHSHNSR